MGTISMDFDLKNDVFKLLKTPDILSFGYNVNIQAILDGFSNHGWFEWVKKCILRLKMYFFVARNNKIYGSRCQPGQGKNYYYFQVNSKICLSEAF